jgi:Ran GTPase-activating protein (RanGAP) involved in mRNA processing and transport
LPVLEVVRLNTRMKALSVIGNGIKNTGVEWLVHMALDHPVLQAIDLSDNRITNAAGTVLNYLAQRNPRIVDLNISNTRIDDQLKHHIELRIKSNRDGMGSGGPDQTY